MMSDSEEPVVQITPAPGSEDSVTQPSEKELPEEKVRDDSNTEELSDKDDFIVELRPPRMRKHRTKKGPQRFQLYLSSPYRGSDDSDSDTSSIIDAPNSAVEEEPKPCTTDNWKSFYSYNERLRPGGPLLLSAEKDFEETESQKSTKDLGLIRNHSNYVQLSIRSKYLQDQLRKLIDVEHYHTIILSASDLIIGHPFAPLFHHIEEMKTNVEADDDASPKDRNLMEALYLFTRFGLPATLFENTRSLLSEGLVTYEDLWALYRPGAYAILRDPLGHYGIALITSVKMEQETRPGGQLPEYRWWITLIKVTTRSKHYRKISIRRRIEIYAGAKRITELDFYPLSHYAKADELKEASLKRGKIWKELNDGKARVMTYQGDALSMVLENPPLNSRRYLPPVLEDEADDGNCQALISTVIVDPDATNKAILQASIDDKQRLWHHSFHDGGAVRNVDVVEFTDAEFIICPVSITVFNLDDHDWYSVDIARLQEKEWKPKSFDRLVLDQDRKETLIRLAKTNSRLVQATKSKDVIEGKGKGVVLLFHGPPGVGKTLTAEVLSEYSKRPLLKVNLGRVASHKKWEQSLESIFHNAEDWSAILLIDEAEIVLEKRTFERMTQNSWISVFLRKLEYYQGILILTTNLVDCMDEAFQSRISYPIQFRELGRDDRHQIWSDFINNMKMMPAYKRTLLDEVDRWSQNEINGRQIRNVILMAENIAASDEDHPRLLPNHIDGLLNVTLEFCDYNQHSSSRTKRIQLTGPSY